jgi:DNA-binding transcriptional MerR regulator
LTKQEVAKILGVSDRKLQRDRNSGSGPRFVKNGRKIGYRPDDLRAFLEANTFTSTAEAKRAKAKLRSKKPRLRRARKRRLCRDLNA